MSTILMTKEFWLNSQFSIARFYGGIKINETRYIIMGSEDLVDDRFAKYYTKLGRDEFMRILEQNKHADKGTVMRLMEEALNAQKVAKKAKQQTIKNLELWQ